MILPSKAAEDRPFKVTAPINRTTTTAYLSLIKSVTYARSSVLC